MSKCCVHHALNVTSTYKLKIRWTWGVTDVHQDLFITNHSNLCQIITEVSTLTELFEDIYLSLLLSEKMSCNLNMTKFRFENLSIKKSLHVSRKTFYNKEYIYLNPRNAMPKQNHKHLVFPNSKKSVPILRTIKMYNTYNKQKINFVVDYNNTTTQGHSSYCNKG
jgi:hypothetical protein